MAGLMIQQFIMNRSSFTCNIVHQFFYAIICVSLYKFYACMISDVCMFMCDELRRILEIKKRHIGTAMCSTSRRFVRVCELLNQSAYRVVQYLIQRARLSICSFQGKIINLQFSEVCIFIFYIIIQNHPFHNNLNLKTKEACLKFKI